LPFGSYSSSVRHVFGSLDVVGQRFAVASTSEKLLASSRR